MLAVQPINNPFLDETTIEGTSFFSNLVSSLVTLFFVAGVVIFVFMLLISAINWITSGGDKAKAAEARNKMFNAFIGLIIMFSIYAVLAIVSALFDFNLVEIDPGELNIL